MEQEHTATATGPDGVSIGPEHRVAVLAHELKENVLLLFQQEKDGRRVRGSTQ